MLSVIKLSVFMLNAIMQGVAMLSVIMLSVIMLSVIMLSVVAPFFYFMHIFKKYWFVSNLFLFLQNKRKRQETLKIECQGCV